MCLGSVDDEMAAREQRERVRLSGGGAIGGANGGGSGSGSSGAGEAEAADTVPYHR